MEWRRLRSCLSRHMAAASLQIVRCYLLTAAAAGAAEHAELTSSLTSFRGIIPASWNM